MVNKWIFFLLLITDQELKLGTHDAYNQLLGTQIKVSNGRMKGGGVKRLAIPKFLTYLVFLKM